MAFTVSTSVNYQGLSVDDARLPNLKLKIYPQAPTKNTGAHNLSEFIIPGPLNDNMTKMIK